MGLWWPIWVSQNPISGLQSVYGQSFDFDANPIGTEVLFHNASTNDDANPFTFALQDYCYMVAFDNGTDANTRSIMMLKYNEVNAQLTADPIQINSGSDGSYLVKGAQIPGGFNFLVVWSIKTATGYGINAQIYTHGSDPFYFARNTLTIKQGQSKIIQNYEINTIGGGTYTYTATYVSFGYFSKSSAGTTPITSFIQQDINNQLIYFTHDGSNQAPFYFLESTDGTVANTTTTQVAVTFKLLPQFLVNSIEIEQNTQVLVTTSMIDGQVADNNVPIFIVYSNLSCHFAIITSPLIPITTFTQDNITSLLIVFIVDDSITVPSYLLGMQDGDGSIVNSTGTVNYYQSTKVLRASFTVQQGATINLARSMLDVSIDSGLIATFIIVKSTAGYFFPISNPQNQLKSFTNEDINSNLIYYIHDGSFQEPNINFLVNDGLVTLEGQSFAITFIPTFYISSNKLVINDGETVIITPQMLEITCSNNCDNSAISIMVLNVIHGQFIMYERNVTSFAFRDILMGQISFAHDNSNESPHYSIEIGNNNYQTSPDEALVSFNGDSPSPILENNIISINQGSNTTIQKSSLFGYDGINNDFNFTFTDVQNAFFAYISDPSTPITEFSQSDVIASKVIFVQDGSTNIPSCNVAISTLAGVTSGQTFSTTIEFILAPQLLANSIEVENGEKTFLSSVNLNSYDQGGSNSLIYYVSAVLYGQFENVNNPRIPINLFYQSDINNGSILFFHDGSSNAPSYMVSVSNGAIKLPPSSAVVEFLVSTGMSGLNQISTVPLEMVNAIQQTSKGEYVFGLLYEGFVVVINTNNPNQAFTQNTLDLTAQKVGKLIKGIVDQNTNILYILSETSTLVSVNTTNPKKPTFLGTVNEEKTVNDLSVGSNYVYIAGLQDGVHIIDIQNPSQLNFKTSFQVKSLTATNNYIISSINCFNSFLFLTSQEASPTESKFIVMSIVDPLNPTFLTEINITGAANYMSTNVNKNKAYVVHDSGIDLIDLSNPLNPTIAATVPFTDPVLHLDVTDDESYLAVITTTKLTILNVQVLDSPIILQSLSYDYGLNQPLFLKRSSYGVIASTYGLLVFEIFQGTKDKMSPTLASYDNYYKDNTENNQQILATPDGQYFLLNTLYKSKQSLLIYQISDQQLIKVVDLNCNNLDSPGMKLTQGGQKVIVTNCGNVTSIGLTPVRAANVQKTINLNGSWGLAVSSDGVHTFVTDKTNTFQIVSIINNQYILRGTLLFSDTPGMLEVNRNINYVFVVLEGKGLAFIDVTNKDQPNFLNLPNNIVNLGDTRSLIYFTTADGGEYIAVSLSYQGVVKIINVKNPLNPIVVASRFIGKQACGLGLFPNNNYLAIQSPESISILEIRNLTTPVIVSEIASETIQPCYRIAVTSEYLVMPTYEMFSLYSGNTYFYPSLDVQTSSQGTKVFYSQLFPINLTSMDISQEKSKLLELTIVGSSFPYWITMDYVSNLLTIFPPDLQSLSSLREILLLFGTQITNTELQTIDPNITEVMRVLLLEHLVDPYGIPTTEYDPNVPINISTSTTLNATAIAYIPVVLQAHLINQYLTFTQQDFLDLDLAPQVGVISLQSQFDSTIGQPKIGIRVNFQFMDTTFTDPDGDNIMYAAYGVPKFLQFSATNLNFFGTPTKTDLGIYNVMVQASDGYKSTTQNFTISLTNSPPQAIPASDQEFLLGRTFDYTFASNTFTDKDGDQLQYAARLHLENGSEIPIPNWLYLDLSRVRLYGTPSISDITRDDENQRFYQQFAINMTAMDVADQTAWFIFHVTCQHSFPQFNENLTLTNQFESKYSTYIKINEKVDFDFSADTFTDADDPIKYTINNLPHWLQFTGTVFYGTTSKDDLGDYNITVIASDGFSNVSDILFISVQNHAPEATTVNNVVLTYGHALQLSLGNPFWDPDNDTLIYRGYEFDEDNSTLNPLPYWIQWDAVNLRMSGTPGPDDVPFNETLNGYFKNYSICVMAIDPGDLTATVNFSLLVISLPPQINANKTLANQFKNLQVQVQVASQKQFDDDTFIDLYNDTITFEAQLESEEAPAGYISMPKRLLAGNSSSSTTALPEWIQFDGPNRMFSMNPTSDNLNFKYVIKVVANNSKLSSSDSFSFTVAISINYAFSLFLSTIGAFGGAGSLMIYRKKIYAVLGKKLYCYPQFDRVNIEDKYQSNVYLIKKDLDLSKKVWKELKKKNKDVSEIFNSNSENPEEKLFEEITFAINTLTSKNQLDPAEEFTSFRMHEIFVGFLMLETIKKHKELNKVFEGLKNQLLKTKGKRWYQDFAIITHPNIKEEASKPFPKVEINEKILKENLENIQKPKIKKSLELTEIHIKLLKGAVKAHVLGIIHPSSKLDSFMEYSRGESILLDWHHLAIEISQNQSKSKVVHGSILDIPDRHNFLSVETWLKNKTEKTVLVFSGKPSKADSGKWIIRIFDHNDVIVREFGVYVVDPNVKSEADITNKYSLANFMKSPFLASLGSPLTQFLDSPAKNEDTEEKNSMGEQKKSTELYPLKQDDEIEENEEEPEEPEEQEETTKGGKTKEQSKEKPKNKQKNKKKKQEKLLELSPLTQDDEIKEKEEDPKETTKRGKKIEQSKEKPKEKPKDISKVKSGILKTSKEESKEISTEKSKQKSKEEKDKNIYVYYSKGFNN